MIFKYFKTHITVAQFILENEIDFLHFFHVCSLQVNCKQKL